MNPTTTPAPAKHASLTPPGARFAFNGILTSKRVCQEFLREFGIKRDWKNTSLAQMQTMLKAMPHERMFLAAQRLCERSGDEFIPQLYMVGKGNMDDVLEETLPDKPKEPKKEAPQASHTPAAAQVTQVEAKSAPSTTPTTTPSKPEPKPEPAAWTERESKAIATITEHVVTQVGASLRVVVDEAIKDKVQNTVKETVKDTVKEAVKDAVDQAVKKLTPAPRELVIKSGTKSVKLEGVQHQEFDKLVKACAARLPDGHRLNIWLYGPPGTGKTSAARTAAKALGLKFATTGSLLTKYDITGFISAMGKVVRSPFREVWEHGGVFLLDEIDGSDPRAIVAFNAALANAVMAFPDKMVERHPDCVMIAAANTSGMGATAEFNGRVKLDQASMDRFVMLHWPIDEAIERAMATDTAWLDTVQRVRMNVAIRGIKGICISPRATFYGCALLESGLPRETVKDMVLRKGMSPEQWALVQ